MPASFSTVVSWKYHAVCYCPILWIFLAKKGKYLMLWTQRRKQGRKKVNPFLKCFFPYSKDLDFQGFKINSVLNMSCNMKQQWQPCCYFKCCVMKCSTGPSFLRKQMDFQGTLLYWLRATTERKLWEMLDISYLIFIYSSQIEMKVIFQESNLCF